MDDVPEEHFAKMDEALAAAFRAMRKDKRMKRGDRQTDQEQAMMHFRIRCAVGLGAVLWYRARVLDLTAV